MINQPGPSAKVFEQQYTLLQHVCPPVCVCVCVCVGVALLISARGEHHGSAIYESLLLLSTALCVHTVVSYPSYVELIIDLLVREICTSFIATQRSVSGIWYLYPVIQGFFEEMISCCCIVY